MSSKTAAAGTNRHTQVTNVASEVVSSRRDDSKNPVPYKCFAGVDDWVAWVQAASPMQRIDVERRGVPAVLLRDLSQRMNIPMRRICTMLGVPKTSLARKVASGAMISGSGGRAVLGMAALLATAQAVVANSTAPEAKDFDFANWLGKWLEHPQAALGDMAPAEIIDTPTGVAVVARLIGAIESGAYQ